MFQTVQVESRLAVAIYFLSTGFQSKDVMAPSYFYC